MNHYETMRYQSVCDCTEWPLLPADRANEEIARLQSIVDSLKWASDLKDEIINSAAGEIARLKQDIAKFSRSRCSECGKFIEKSWPLDRCADCQIKEWKDWERDCFRVPGE